MTPMTLNYSELEIPLLVKLSKYNPEATNELVMKIIAPRCRIYEDLIHNHLGSVSVFNIHTYRFICTVVDLNIVRITAVDGPYIKEFFVEYNECLEKIIEILQILIGE